MTQAIEHNEYDCDTLAQAMRACVANMIERMRDDYHNHDTHYADEAINFIIAQLGEGDAAEIITQARRLAYR